MCMMPVFVWQDAAFLGTFLQSYSDLGLRLGTK